MKIEIQDIGQLKSIIFFGTHGLMDTSTADEKFNIWTEHNKDVIIEDIQYRQGSDNIHSICVIFRERINND